MSVYYASLNRITETEGAVSRVFLLTQTGSASSSPTGGTITTSGAYTIHTFTASGTFTATSGLSAVEVLVVGGGGGGGAGVLSTLNAGGGGAGGVLYSAALPVSATSYAVTVGAGGGSNANGGNSAFSSLTAVGGGHGAGGAYANPGGAGGSGGGEGTAQGGGAGAGTAGQGYAGAAGSGGADNYRGGGGGGGGGASAGINGGAGVANSITGVSVTYAGGGGAGTNAATGGSGGTGGGTGGGSSSAAGTNGSANTGSGGGGSAQWSTTGGSGGSGIVIIRYLTGSAGSSNNTSWQLQEGDGTTWLRTTTHTGTDNGNGTRDDMVTVRTGGTAGTIVAKTKFRYTTLTWGEEVTQIVADPDGAALTTAYDYYATAAAYGNYRKVKSVTDPTGNWTAYQYYDDWNRRGQLQYEFHPFVDAPAAVSLNPALGRVVSFDYTADWTGRYTRPTVRQEKTNNVLTGQTQWVNGDIVGSGWQREYSTVYTWQDGSSYQVDYDEHFRGDAGLEFPYRPYTTKAANQAQTAISEASGSYNASTYAFTADGSNGGWRRLIIHGSTNASGAQAVSSWNGQTFGQLYLIPNVSTMEATINDIAGNPLRTESWVYTGAGVFSLVASENLTYNYAGRLTQRVASNGATTTNTYANGRLTSNVDATGTETQFTYDLIGRIASSIVSVAPGTS